MEEETGWPRRLWADLQEKGALRGAWVAQSVKRLTLDFGSGHGLTVHETGAALMVQSLLGILSLPLCLSLARALALALSRSRCQK